MAITLKYNDVSKLTAKYGWDVLKDLTQILDQRQFNIQLDEKRVTPPKWYGLRDRLLKQFNIDEKRLDDLIDYYGLAGARNYLYREHDIPIPEPADMCDDRRKEILNTYRKIRDSEGIKKAVNYFYRVDKQLVSKAMIM